MPIVELMSSRRPLVRPLDLDLDLDFLPNSTRSFDQRVELNRNVFSIEDTIELRAARSHLLGHFKFCQLGVFQALFELFREKALECSRLDFVEDLLLLEEIVGSGTCTRITSRNAATP